MLYVTKGQIFFLHLRGSCDVMKSPVLKPRELEFKFHFYLVYMQPRESAGCVSHDS